MSILSSLAGGIVLHAHNGATAVDPALVEGVRLTLNEIMRGLQVLFICALFYGVVRFFWWFISNATAPVVAPVVERDYSCDSLGCDAEATWAGSLRNGHDASLCDTHAPAPLPEWDAEPVFSTCEDYPCCGHTDGLGCNWVSPNEVKPCQVCIDARANYPYHDGYSCPTVEKAQRENVPAGSMCKWAGEDCENEANFNIKGEGLVCYECMADLQAYNASMQEQYDDEWRRW